MKIIAQVCWFDEPPEHLKRLIDSMAGMIDDAIFLDGRYASFPGDCHTSGLDTIDYIYECAQGTGIHQVIQGGRLYATQTEKRTEMFEIAADFGDFEDYALIIDADETLHGDFAEARRLLESECPDTALVSLNTPGPNGRLRTKYRRQRGIHMPANSTKHHGRGVPRIMRMLDDVIVGPKHHGSYTGVNEDGVRICLKDRNREHAGLPRASTLDLTDVLEIRNHTWSRTMDRIHAKHEYGMKRGKLGEDQ